MDRLDQLFADFLRERIYLRNVSDKTRIWYATAWKAFRRETPHAQTLTRAELQAFVLVSLLNIPYVLWPLRLRARD